MKLLIIMILFSANVIADTIDSMVMGISSNHNQASIDTNSEYYGVILSDEHGNLTHTVEYGAKNEEIISFIVRRKVTQSIVAIWHTHGAKGRDKEYFSNHDTSASKYYNVPIYMMDSSWQLRVFNPNDKTYSSTAARRRGLVAGMAKGSLVNQSIASISR